MGSAFMALSAIFALIISSVRLLAKLYEYRLPTLCPLLNLDLETVKSLLISSVRRRYGIEAHRLFRFRRSYPSARGFPNVLKRTKCGLSRCEVRLTNVYFPATVLVLAVMKKVQIKK